MYNYNKKLGALLLAAGMAFSGAAQAEDAAADLGPAQDQGWYDALRPLSFLKDPETQCVPAARLGQARNKDMGAKAAQVVDIMARAPIADAAAKAFAARDGAYCLIDFKKEYGENVTAFAMHFDSYRAILINDAPDVAQGCTVAATIHETHHAVQDIHGYGIKRELSRDAQEDMILGIESDAHAMQIAGAYELTLAAEPYEAAHECNKTVFAEMPHMRRALEAFDAAVAADPAALRTVVAAGAAYGSLVTDFSLFSKIFMGHQRFL